MAAPSSACELRFKAVKSAVQTLSTQTVSTIKLERSRRSCLASDHSPMQMPSTGCFQVFRRVRLGYLKTACFERTFGCILAGGQHQSKLYSWLDGLNAKLLIRCLYGLLQSRTAFKNSCTRLANVHLQLSPVRHRGQSCIKNGLFSNRQILPILAEPMLLLTCIFAVESTACFEMWSFELMQKDHVWIQNLQISDGNKKWSF